MDNFHFHFGSDADVSDTNRHFLEYEYRIFQIIRYHFPPLIMITAEGLEDKGVHQLQRHH